MAAGLAMIGLDGRGLTGAVETELAAGRLAGLILFREDAPDLGALAALIAEARALSPVPILIGMDEEGGIVSQLDGLALGGADDLHAVGAPSPGALSVADDVVLTRRVHHAVGELLSAIGVDVVFAPVADVNVRVDNPVIGSRAFGADPARVIRHARAAVQGLSAGGVRVCAKHFPGHGAASVDSHVALPTIDDPRDVLDARDLAPFRALIDERVPAIMVGHLVVPALDAARAPASRSGPILHDLLRKELGFGGVVVSDALEMAGFGASGGLDAPVADAYEAGVDLFVLARGVERAPELVRALEAARVFDPGDGDARAARLASLAGVAAAGAGEAAIRAAAARHRSLLLEAWTRTVRVLRAGAPISPGETVRLVVNPGIPRARLDPDLAVAGLLEGGVGEVEVVPPDRAVDGISRGVPVVVALYGRGRLPDPLEQAMARIEAWRGEEPGRRVTALAPADPHVLTGAPAGWGRVAMAGSGLTAFRATAEALVGRTGPRTAREPRS